MNCFLVRLKGSNLLPATQIFHLRHDLTHKTAEQPQRHGGHFLHVREKAQHQASWQTAHVEIDFNYLCTSGEKKGFRYKFI